MRPWVLAAIAFFAVMSVYMADRNGYNRAIKETNAQAARAAQQALDEQNELQIALNTVASAYHQSITQEQVKYERLKYDFKSKRSVRDCVTDSAGTVTATLSDDAVRMLEQRRSSAALPEAGAGQSSDREERTPPAL